MCCSSGKVKLKPLLPPPEQFQALMLRPSPQSKHFLANSREYNSIFKMTFLALKKLSVKLTANFQGARTSLSSCPSGAGQVNHLTPVGEYERRFNSPETNEVAIVNAGNECSKKDIVLTKRNNQIQRVSETHRSLDVLQYPLLFFLGQNGYNFLINNKGKSFCNGILRLPYDT